MRISENFEKMCGNSLDRNRDKKRAIYKNMILSTRGKCSMFRIYFYTKLRIN
jgi:hypothetical protein